VLSSLQMHYTKVEREIRVNKKRKELNKHQEEGKKVTKENNNKN
jgi:hypothetical protein